MFANIVGIVVFIWLVSINMRAQSAAKLHPPGERLKAYGALIAGMLVEGAIKLFVLFAVIWAIISIFS